MLEVEELQSYLDEILKAYLTGDPFSIAYHMKELEMFLLAEDLLIQAYSMEELMEARHDVPE